MKFIRTPNQQDLSWFIDMDNQKRLELDPPYQRKSVWTYKDKQFFLDTVLKNYPCPAIYLQKENTEKGPLYNVVDGKQRLSTILDFHNGKIRLSKNFSIAEFQGMKFMDLPDSTKSEFYNYIFMVEQIRNDSEKAVDWGQVFQRVNKNQKTLSDQELRHAKYDGWLINRAENEVLNDIWKTLGIASKTRKARMKDAEFASILMLVILENDFIGFPQFRIDELYAKYDFKLSELPQDENESGLSDVDYEDEVFDGITADVIEKFETTFDDLIKFIEAMENHNNCITLHKKRLFTDFYSLWCALVFEESLMKEKTAEEIALIYEKFISLVDQAYVISKEGGDLENFDKNALIYFGNSTGAATEIEPRKNRHQAFIDYVNRQ